MEFRDGEALARLGQFCEVKFLNVVFDTHAVVFSIFLRFSSARAFARLMIS